MTALDEDHETSHRRPVSCGLGGGATGAAATALLLWGWPIQDGVIWTVQEQWLLASAGATAGGLLGGLLGLASQRAGPVGSALAGTIPAMLLLSVPWIPVTGRTLLRTDPAGMGVALGAALVFWGTLRLVRRPILHGLLFLVPLTMLRVTWPATSARPPPPPPGPDVLLITVDTTRADLVPGFKGDLAAAEMPALEHWARNARRFDQAYAPTALTGPSHTSILSGRHVSEHGIVANGRTIPQLLPLVPMILQHHGWVTRAHVSAAVLDGRLGFDRGFAHYDARFSHRLLYGHPLFAAWPRRSIGGTGFVRKDADTVDLAIQRGFSDPAGRRRVFTWVHLYGPHWPYEPDPIHAAALGVEPTIDGAQHGPVPLNFRSDIPAAVQSHATALYRAELRTLDDQLARLFAAAGADTRIVLAADHGESLDEHGLLFNHGRLATAPSARVPIWVKGPGYLPGVDHRTVALHQVGPTLLALADLSTARMGTPLHASAEDAAIVTLSARSVFDNDQARPDAALGELASLAVRVGAWSKSASLWHPVQWSYLPTDPRELTDAIDPAVPPEVRASIEDAWAEAIALALEAPEEADAEAEAALEALGYLTPSSGTE